jgi:hypothetical protein
VCGDRAVRKAVMAPAVVRSSTPAQEVAAAKPELSPEQVKAAMAVAMLRKLRQHVETHFEDVGDRFPTEVRRIHAGEAEARDLFGRATLEEARELLEEGIPVRPLPELPNLDG